MTNAVLYILCGFPYSGKSRLAYEIQKQKNCNCVSIDEINGERGFKSSKDLEDKDWEASYEIAYQKIADSLRNGQSVVYDGSTQTHKQREILKKLTKKYNAKYKIIYVKVSKIEIANRELLNLGNPSHANLNEKEIQYVINHFQEPNPHEALIYDESIEPNSWVAKFL